MSKINTADLLKHGFQFFGKFPGKIEYIESYSTKKGSKNLENLCHLFKDVKTGEKVMLVAPTTPQFYVRGFIGLLFEYELDFTSTGYIKTSSSSPGKKSKFYPVGKDFSNLFANTLAFWFSRIDFKVKKEDMAF